MSALGHKPTYALQQGMAALLPITTAKADIRYRLCLLRPESGHVQCTRQCQLRAKSGHHFLFDYIVGSQHQTSRDCVIDCLGGS
jgi:hypothetical protein